MTTVSPAPGAKGYARAAGTLFLLYITLAAAGSMVSGHFAAALQGASPPAVEVELGYRGGVLLSLMGGLCALPLGFSLFKLLSPINRDWSLFAFVCRALEGALNLVSASVGIVGSAVLAGRVAPRQTESFQAERAFVHVTGQAVVATSILAFSMGSVIFFTLFSRSRILPRWLSYTGVVGSIAAMALSAGELLLPSPPGWLPALWAPLTVAEVVGGVLLLAARSPDLQPVRKR